MFEDFIKGVREYISDRFMSPLGASLTVSWCAWNYKVLLIVFSGESAIRKIHLIHLVYQDFWYSAFHLAAGPLATAAFYILAFPYPSNWVYSYSLRRRKEALNLKREIDDQTVLTQEESRALRIRFTEMDVQHTTESVRLTSTIDSLKDQLKQVIEERDALAEEVAARRAASAVETPSSPRPPSRPVVLKKNGESIELDRYQWQIVNAVGRSGSNTYVRDLSAQLKIGDAAIWLVAGQLEELGLVSRGTVDDYDSGSGIRVLSLTDLGLRLFIESLK